MRAVCLSIAAIAVLVGCSSEGSPNPRYSELSVKLDSVVKRTQGDPNKLTTEDLQVVADAKSLGMTTPPGY